VGPEWLDCMTLGNELDPPEERVVKITAVKLGWIQWISNLLNWSEVQLGFKLNSMSVYLVVKLG